MKETKKVFSLLLSVMMMFSIIMVPAHAEGTDEPEEGTGQSWRKWVEQLEGEPEEAMTVIPGTEPAPAPAPIYEAGSLEAESSNYKVVVTYGEDAKIPAGTVATVTEYAEGSAEYEAAKATLLQEKSEDDFAGFVAFDISLYNGDELVEPQSQVDVTVSVNLNALPEEAVEAADTLELQHHDETTGTAVLDVIATAEEIEVGNEDAIVNFAVDSFSTFTITWGGYYGTSYRVTIHHGVMINGTFTEFGTNGLPSSSNSVYPSTLNIGNYGTDNNNRYAYLIYDFPGYTYSNTYYRTNESSTPASGGTEIKAVLRKENGSTWNYRRTNSWDRDVANNSHIYVVYTAKTISQGADGSGSGDGSGQDQFVPDVGKNVTDQKPDGTYDITLGFVGDKQPASYAKARVIVVFDRSGSMSSAVSNTDSTVRLTAAKNAVNAMAEKLLAITDDQGNKLVEMGLVSFGTNAQIETFGNNVQFTSNYNTGTGGDRFKAKVDGFTTSNLMGGTNWEKALDLANSMTAASDAKTYIVFISDGDPTFRTSRGNYLDYNTGTGQNLVYGLAQENSDYGGTDAEYIADAIFGYGNNNYDTNNRCYDAAELVGESIVEANKAFYTVGLSSDATRMSNLATATGGKFYDGSNSTAFANAMAEIAGQIEEAVGLTDVTITDGVTSMSHIETQSLIGTTGNFEYFKSYPLTQNGSSYTYTMDGTDYTVTQSQVDAGSDGTHRIYSRRASDGTTVLYIEYPWENAPEAEINANNAVVWDTNSANSELEHGVYYSVKFTVWPRQEAYDLIADLDNGIVKVTDADLAAGTKAQLRVLVNGTTYEYDTASGTWSGGLTDAQLQALIDANDATFSMKTNTGLSAAYKYGGVDSTANYTNYVNGNMSLDDTSIKIKKTWNNYMDAREASNVTLTIVRDGENYMDFSMGKPVEISTTAGGKQWVQTPEDELFISLGVLSVADDGTITVRETGYDYTVIEPPYFSYRWDLTADIYHPMVINGVSTVLIEIQDTEGLPEEVVNLAENKSVKVGEITYYNFNDHLYETKAGENLLEATNDRRSNLIINKVVADESAPEEDVFPIQVTVTNPNAPKPGEEGYSETYHTSWFFVSTAENDRKTIVMDGVTVEGATAELGELKTNDSHITNIVLHEADDTYPFDYITYDYDGSPNTVKAEDLELHSGTDDQGNAYSYYSYYTGFYWFDNAATATVYIRDGWYVNFNNVARNSEYTVVEPTAKMPDGYTFDVATSAATNVQAEEVTPATIDGITATGTIDKSNSDYKVTYNNKYEGVFYVYHSANNDVYRYPMAVDGVKVENFNIYELTAENTLYGGYYSNYSGKSEGYDSAALTYTNNKSHDDNGTVYVGNKKVWAAADVLTTNGTAMHPERDVTYYLKEVPQYYLKPYTHYSYTLPSRKINYMWFMSGIDDSNYSSFGYEITILNNGTMQKADKASASLKITNNSGSVTLKALNIFKQYGMVNDAYLAYYKNTMGGTYVKENNELAIRQYWVTKDGITVFGNTTRTIKINDGVIDNIEYEDVDA